LIERDGKPVGSELIGMRSPNRNISGPGRRQHRPIHTTRQRPPARIKADQSALTDAVAARIKALRDADPGNAEPVPVDLVTASGSGLDPQISPAAASTKSTASRVQLDGCGARCKRW
jgi:K+-transporting ATPase ATPase C chain